MRTTLSEAVEDGLCEIGIMEDPAECRQRPVGGDDRGAAREVLDADDAEADVGGIGGVALVAELVDDEDVRVHVGLKRPASAAWESSPMSSSAEVKRVSMPFWMARYAKATATWVLPRAREDGRAALAEQLGAEQGAEHLQAHRGLEGEVKGARPCAGTGSAPCVPSG